MTLELSEIKININFENLIPKQTAEQFKQLEENMVSEGRARNPLVLWRGTKTLVDGHHRLKVLKAHPELKWSVVEQDFSDEDSVKEWIIKNALGTRNLTEVQFRFLLAELYKMRKKRHGAPKGNKNAEKQSTQNGNIVSDAPTRVSEQLAKEMGVAKNTVIRAEQFVDGIDTAEKAVPGVKEKIVSGELKAQRGEVIGWRKKTPDEIKKSVKEIESRGSKKRKPTDKAFFAKLKEIDAIASGVTTTQYGLAELIREIDALGDSFAESLAAIIKRRKSVIDAYDGQAEIDNCIDNIIKKLSEIKKGSI